LPDTEQLQRWAGAVLLDMGDGILPFGKGDRSSTISKETLLFGSRSVASTDVLSTPMSGSSVVDYVAADVTIHDERCSVVAG
jgi:hypothetical protein